MASTKLRSPIGWFGGKGNMVSKLLKLLPPHDSYKIYVEVFGGGGSLLFAKEPSPVEIFNDIDSDLINFFRVLRDEEKFEKFYRKVYCTPYSREEFLFCRETWENCDDEIERAYRFYITARMSFSGEFGSSWSYSVSLSRRNMSASCSRWLSTIEMLPEIHGRLMRVQIENDDFRNIIKRYDTENTLFYLDPPYVASTRKSGKYRYEMTEEDHEELVNLLLNIRGKALLSGYKNEIYKTLENAGWIRIDFETVCYAAGRTKYTKILGEGKAKEKQRRVESVWLSPGLAVNLKGVVNK